MLAKTTPSISLLSMAVLACSWLMATTAENPSRTERQYTLNGDYAIPYYYGPHMDLPSFSYIPETRAALGFFNRPFATSAPASSGERTFQTLVNLLSGRPLCAACPACPSCPTCPVVPVIPAQAITLAPLDTKCTTAKIEDTADALTTCSAVSAAPTGIIDVKFVGPQTVTIGIVAVAPNTKITLTCSAVPSATGSTVLGAKTQDATITITKKLAVTFPKGFVLIIASGDTDADKDALKCRWDSS